MDNLAEWISKGVDSVGIGSLLTKGSKLQISENAKKIREIIDNTRKSKSVN